MKILGINGSPRGSQSQTLRLVEAVLKGVKVSGAGGGRAGGPLRAEDRVLQRLWDLLQYRGVHS